MVLCVAGNAREQATSGRARLLKGSVVSAWEDGVGDYYRTVARNPVRLLLGRLMNILWAFDLLIFWPCALWGRFERD